MSLFRQAPHCPSHSFKEEAFGLLLAAMAIRRSDQLLGFGYGEGSKEIGKYWAQGTAQPDVEEVGEIGVADVVVVWRIC